MRPSPTFDRAATTEPTVDEEWGCLNPVLPGILAPDKGDQLLCERDFAASGLQVETDQPQHGDGRD
ncbi:hypothetical protein GCM10010399_55460 [Dactylosporangium fulvum]